MEGIQHRLDCPAKDDSHIHVHLRTWGAFKRLECAECGRAAWIPLPEETSDEQ